MVRKSLLGATALVAVTAAGSAFAATAPTLKITGSYSTAIVFGDSGQPSTTNVSFEDNAAYIVFNAEGVADNGLTYGARAQFRATNIGGADRVKDNYVYFSGGFGRIEFGGLKGVTSKMAYAGPAPDGAALLTINSPTYWPFGSSTVSNSVKTVTTWAALAGRAEKINYYTPRIEGFQLGLTYTPHGCSDGSSIPTRGSNATGSGVCVPSGGFESTNVGEAGQDFEVGLNFNRNFSGIVLGVSGTYAYQEAPGTYVSTTGATVSGLKDRDSYNFGLNVVVPVGAGKFTVGGAYQHVDKLSYADNTDKDAYEAGIQYATGPWTVGVEGGYIEKQNGTTARGAVRTLKTLALAVGGGYQLAQGLTLSAGYMHYSYGYEDHSAATKAPDDSNVFLIGTKLTF